jgi:hypothetical protein
MKPALHALLLQNVRILFAVKEWHFGFPLNANPKMSSEMKTVLTTYKTLWKKATCFGDFIS